MHTHEKLPARSFEFPDAGRVQFVRDPCGITRESCCEIPLELGNVTRIPRTSLGGAELSVQRNSGRTHARDIHADIKFNSPVKSKQHKKYQQAGYKQGNHLQVQADENPMNLPWWSVAECPAQ